jgi:lipid-A-disaccharide synthase
LIQNEFTASNIVREITPLLPDGTPRQSMMKDLAELRGLLQPRTSVGRQETGRAEGAVGRTAGARAAEITLELLERSGDTSIAAGR